VLSQTYPLGRLRDALIAREDWHPFPTVSERNTWDALPESVRKAYIARGEEAIGHAWPPLPATLFLEFARTGNRNRYERVSFGRRTTLGRLAMAECVEGKGRFVDDIVNGIWAICEETFWGIPACMYMQEAGPGLPDVEDPVVPLFVGETAGLLAWTLYLLGPQLDAVSPLIRPRLHLEMDRRVLTPCLERDDFWWMGFGNRSVNNWNPWVNSNWLAAALLMEQDPQRRLDAVAKVLRSLDNFIDPYPTDGGCDEGPGYWGRAGASLYDCLETLYSATGGAVDVYGEPLIQNIGRYIYRAQIRGRYFVNFADAPAITTPSGPIVFGFGRRIGDARMQSLGAWAAGEQQVADHGFSGSIGRQLAALPTLHDLLCAEPAQPLPRDVWFPEIQVMGARDREGSGEGLFVAAKGGHNAESHNHNDIGNFIVYVDGRPVIIDVGVETYSARTFGPERYEIWSMQSAYHSLPTVNGVMQQAGKTYAAREVEYRADEASAGLTLDIAAAYPRGAGLGAWWRSITLNRGRDVEIVDRYALTSTAAELTVSLVTPCQVNIGGSGEIALEQSTMEGERVSGAARLRYDSGKLSATVEDIVVEDDRLKGIWGERIRRIILRTENPPQSDTWTIQITA